jgi:hypothetical protein
MKDKNIATHKMLEYNGNVSLYEKRIRKLKFSKDRTELELTK